MNPIFAQVMTAATKSDIEQSRDTPASEGGSINEPHPMEVDNVETGSANEGAGGSVPKGSAENGSGSPAEPQGSTERNPQPQGAPAEPSNESSLARNVPDWIPEHLRPTTEDFDYRKSYSELLEQLGSKQFYDGFLEQVQDQLMSSQQEIDNFAQHFRAFQNNPREYLKTWMPDIYQEIGVSIRGEDEFAAAVDRQMQGEFGKNYREQFDSSDVLNMGTISAKMWNRSYELRQQMEQENKKAAELIEQRRAALAAGERSQPEQRFENIDQAIDAAWQASGEQFQKENVTREEFDAFLRENAERQLTPLDIYRATNYARDIERAKAAGIEEGRKLLSKELNIAYQAPPEEPEEPKPDPNPASQKLRSSYFTDKLRPHFKF